MPTVLYKAAKDHALDSLRLFSTYREAHKLSTTYMELMCLITLASCEKSH